MKDVFIDRCNLGVGLKDKSLALLILLGGVHDESIIKEVFCSHQN